jgi:hypothetical protein
MGELVVVSLEDGAPPNRVLTVNPATERSVNKTRYSALLPYVVEPTYDKITEAIMARRVANSRPAAADAD